MQQATRSRQEKTTREMAPFGMVLCLVNGAISNGYMSEKQSRRQQVQRRQKKADFSQCSHSKWRYHMAM
ncbi:unnamed protein product [Trifolium pratense]|uniref:Uncharacterized protein n=1 Tax=Trifolium pratense TaxID=57577 RepID=A0ACB0LUD7_TRIPR|nr:unnamed protein product [Trifolium pratense]